MKRFGFAVLLTAFALSSAMAQGTCQSRAIDKNGKPLAGAALNSFMTKCAKDTCEPKAFDKNGKPLVGAGQLHEKMPEGRVRAWFSRWGFPDPEAARAVMSGSPI